MHSNSTQGLSTQNPTNQQRFIDWCKSFVQEYKRRFENPEQETTEEAEEKFRENFIKFLEPNLADDGKRYKLMFKNLVAHSICDKGDLFYDFMGALFLLMEKYKADDDHRLHLLYNFLKIFEVEDLDPDLACDLEILYKEQIGKVSAGLIHDIYSQTSTLFKIEEITTKRSIKLFVWLSTLRGNGISNRAVMDKLLNNCTHKAINGVVGVICDDDQTEIFQAYAAKFLTTGFLKDISYQKLGFAKITAALRNFTEIQIHDIIVAFCEAWADKDALFFDEVGNEIAEFTTALHRHPLFGKSVVKIFKKHKKYVRTSVFGLICQIGLISSYRYEQEISKMLSTSLSKIWQFADNLETDGWIYTIIKDLELRKIKSKFQVIIEFIQKCQSAADVLARGLTILSIQLMESSSKKSSFNIIKGKLEHIENDISFIGRRLLVDTILSVPPEITNKYTTEPLQALVAAIFSNATKIPNVYFFIDALVELRNTNAGMLIMNWEIFDKLALHICDLPSEVGVKIMSALMPVIIQREGLRSAIFDSLKVEMLSISKVSTTLPVMFQLLRSLIEQPETKAAFQCSQSFASFSSQLAGSKRDAPSSVLNAIPIIECIKRCMHQSPATKCLVYKGIVDLCKKNNYFVLHGLDLLLGELTSLPKLDVDKYMGKTAEGSNYVKYQCPHLLKATYAVLSAASISCENVPQFGSTQLSQNGVDTINKANIAVNKYINNIVDTHLEDIKLDKENEHLKKHTSETSYYKAFGLMMIQLYDVIIECLWDFENSDYKTEETAKKIEALIVRRKTLYELLEKVKGEKDSDTSKTDVVESSKAVVQDLQIDIPKLSVMLEDLDLPVLEGRAAADGITLKDVFLPWILHRIHDSVSLLNPKSSTCLSSMKSLTSMACSLLKFYSSMEPSSSSDAVIKNFVISQTKAVESYSNILIYILSKYQGKCAEPLKEIFENVISSQYDDIQDFPQYTQVGKRVAEVAEIEIDHTDGDNINAAGFNIDFRVYSAKHIAAYYQKILPAIFSTRQAYESRKTLNDYHKQIVAFLNIARKLTSMLTSSSNEIRSNVMDLILEIGVKYKIDDKNAQIDFWKAVLEIISHSNCDEKWIGLFNKLVGYMICLVTEKDDVILYKSLNGVIASQFYVAITRTISYLLTKVRIAINVKIEIGDKIEDDFLTSVCCITEEFADSILQIVKIDDELVTGNEQMVTGAIEMLTDLYVTMSCIAQQFKTIMAKVNIDEWSSLCAFDRVLGEKVDKIVKESANKFGRGKYSKQQTAKASKPAKTPVTAKSSKSTKPSKSKKSDSEKKAEDEAKAEQKAKRQHDDIVRRNKKDEKLFVRLDKEFEIFHGVLIIIEQKYGNEDRPLNLPAAGDKAMRVFKIDEEALADVFDANDESGGDDEGEASEREIEASEKENDASEKENDASEEENGKDDDSDASAQYDY